MSLETFDTALTLVLGFIFLFRAVLFGMVWQTSRYLMQGQKRTRLSKAQHNLTGGLVFSGLGFGIGFLGRHFPFGRELWFIFGVRALIITGAIIITVAGVQVFRALLQRLSDEEDANIQQALWEASAKTRDAAANLRDTTATLRDTAQVVREVRQDGREDALDARTDAADKRGRQQDVRGREQSLYGLRLDERSHDQDARDVVATDRDTLADEREKQEGTP